MKTVYPIKESHSELFLKMLTIHQQKNDFILLKKRISKRLEQNYYQRKFVNGKKAG